MLCGEKFVCKTVTMTCFSCDVEIALWSTKVVFEVTVTQFCLWITRMYALVAICLWIASVGICCTSIIIIIMYFYHALINVLSTHMIHINLNMIFYTRVKHSPTKAIYIKYYRIYTHTHTHTHKSTTNTDTHTHTHTITVAETGYWY